MTRYQRQVLAAVAAIGILDNSNSTFSSPYYVSLREVHTAFEPDSNDELIAALNWLEAQGFLDGYRRVHCYYGGERELGDKQWKVTKLGLVELWAP